MIKTIVFASLTLFSSALFAQHWQHGHRHHGHARYYGHSGWVAPLIIGGVVGAVIANRPVQAETVIIQRQPIYVPQESCTPWKEIQTPDGQTYRERTCTQ
jgi:hypothetical protein